MRLQDWEILAIGWASRYYDSEEWFRSSWRQWLVDMHLLKDDRWNDVGDKAASQVLKLKAKQ